MAGLVAAETFHISAGGAEEISTSLNQIVELKVNSHCALMILPVGDDLFSDDYAEVLTR